MHTNYQTIPLDEYESHLRDRAADLFVRVQKLLGQRQTRRYKGSYSFFGPASSATAMKVIIFQAGRVRVTLEDGVYVLIRANGPLVDSMRSCSIWKRANRDQTISIAPNWSEHFAYFRLSEHDDVNEIACAIERCLSATQPVGGALQP